MAKKVPTTERGIAINKLNRTISSKLISLRGGLGKTQKELAFELLYDHPLSYNSLEKGHTIITVFDLLKFSEIFDKPLEYFIYDEVVPKEFNEPRPQYGKPQKYINIELQLNRINNSISELNKLKEDLDKILQETPTK